MKTLTKLEQLEILENKHFIAICKRDFKAIKEIIKQKEKLLNS